MHKFILHSQILKTVVELRIGHVDWELLENIFLFRIEIESHLGQPLEGFGSRNFLLDENTYGVTLMYQLDDLGKKTSQELDLDLIC